jgi:hypothetical protein
MGLLSANQLESEINFLSGKKYLCMLISNKTDRHPPLMKSPGAALALNGRDMLRGRLWWLLGAWLEEGRGIKREKVAISRAEHTSRHEESCSWKAAMLNKGGLRSSNPSKFLRLTRNTPK